MQAVSAVVRPGLWSRMGAVVTVACSSQGHCEGRGDHVCEMLVTAWPSVCVALNISSFILLTDLIWGSGETSEGAGFSQSTKWRQK